MRQPTPPRCLAGVTPDVLHKLKKALEKQKEVDSELIEVLDRLIDLAEQEIDNLKKEE